VSNKRLIIRLSSLGDVILATSALSALPPPSQSEETHWVVAREYAGLIKGHPRLTKVWEFDRSKGGGILAWLSLCEKLWKEGFTEVLDLHSTLRSMMARIYFLSRAKMSKREIQWKTISKERWKLTGLFAAKRFWPESLRPTPLVVRFAKLAGGTGAERPDLRHLVNAARGIPPELKAWVSAQPEYLCVMPSSKWDGKKWNVRGFYEVLIKTGVPVIVLGDKSDRESVLLAKLLGQAQFPHFSSIGKLGFGELASILAGARAYFGNDTGLAHLAEAVGTGAITLFGPTIPEMGFGPWRPESRAVSLPMWCRPCGKDGRYCFRVKNRYACQSELKPTLVARELQGFLTRG